jgi:hypothetical protein
MSIKRYAIAFMLGGIASKALLIQLWKLIQSPELLSFLTTYDPVARAFAERLASLFSNPKGIAPGPGASEVFEAALIVGFGLECMFVGLAFRWLLGRLGGPGQVGEMGPISAPPGAQ